MPYTQKYKTKIAFSKCQSGAIIRQGIDAPLIHVASGDLPKVVECNTARSLVAAGDGSAYDGFKDCKVALAKRARLLHEVKSVHIKDPTYLIVVYGFGA